MYLKGLKQKKSTKIVYLMMIRLAYFEVKTIEGT